MNSKITFPRLATLLADQSGRSKRFSEDFLREFFALISENLERGEIVKVKGFGTFRLSKVESRKSVDVTTGLPMEISSHTKVTFTPAKELAETVNSPFEAFTTIEIADDIDVDNLIPIEEDIREDTEYESEETGSMQQPAIASVAIALSSDEQVDSTGNEMLSQAVDSEKTIHHNDYEINAGQDFGKTEAIEEIEAIRTPYHKKHGFVQDEEENGGLYSETGGKKLKNESDYAGDDEPEIEATDVNTFEDIHDETETNTDSEHEINEEGEYLDEEYSEEEKRQKRRRNIIRGIYYVVGAAIFGLVITFGIWYFVASNDFKKAMEKPTATVAGLRDIIATAPAATQATAPAETEESIENETDSLESGITEAIVPTAPSDALVYDTISLTRYLTTMAKAHYGNYNLWPYIYEENKSILGHPDRIRPGTQVVIPKLSKYGVDPYNDADIERAKQMGVEIYARYGKKI